MFKKLKDKIAEEVKQSPLKFQNSVQQFTQSVSPSLLLSNNSLNETDTILNSNDDESGERQNQTDYDNSFTTVDLRSPVGPKARRSSSSSINSELFPVYEFPRQLTLQSDLESCSEFDDGSSIHQFNNVTKESLYEKYRTALQKYHKYRGRFSDLQKFCKELQRELSKAKNVLTETQDKAIRRIAELKEQCSLEQKAKAHLEDSWRNELEERDHLINTLNTKIDLLKAGKNNEDEEVPIITLETSSNDGSNKDEADVLKEKIKKFESLLNNAKDTITNKTAQIKDMLAKTEEDEKKLKSAQDRIADLEENIDLMKHKEEEALLSLAENKLHVHQELEAKESQIKTLKKKIAELNDDMKKLKHAKTDNEKPSEMNETRSDTKNSDLETLKRELQLLTATRVTDQNTIAEKDRLIREFKTTIDASNQELSKLRNEMESSALFSRIEDSDLKNVLKQTQATAEQLESSLAEKQREFESTIHELNVVKVQLEQKVQKLEQELSVVKTELLEKNTLCENLDDKTTTLTCQLTSCKSDLARKLSILKEKQDEVQRLTLDLTNANAKIKEFANEKRIWTETETHLKADKIVLEEQIKSVRKELNSAQVELKDARSAINEREKNANEKKKLEKLLAERESESAQLKIELEHETLVRTASLMEEINSLKTKEDSHLSEMRKLKTDIRNLQDKLKENETLKKKSDELNENLTMKVEQLNAEIHNKQKLENELDRLREDLTSTKRVNESLNNELDQLKRSSQEIDDVKSKFDSLQLELREANALKECVQKERDELEVEIERLKREFSELMNELEITRSPTDTIDSEQNRELIQKMQSEQLKLSQEREKIVNQVTELENRNELLSKQIETLRMELIEEKNKHESIEDVNRNLRDEISQIQQHFENFLSDVKPVLENCAEMKKRLVHVQRINENLVRQNTAQIDIITQLESQLNRSNEKNNSSSEDLFFNLSERVTQLKKEYVQMKSAIVEELDLLRRYCCECNVKINNGPLKIIQDHITYNLELEDRLSECERMKTRKLECEHENRELLERVELLTSKSLNVENESLLNNLEEEYTNKIEMIVTDYENQLLRKDKEYEKLQNSTLAKDKARITAMSNETKEIIQNMEEELALKQDALEKLIEKQQEDVDKFNHEIVEIKELHAKELRESDKRWRSCLDKKVQEVEDKYKDEINELTKEWSADRKQATCIDISQRSEEKIESNEQTLEKYALRNENAEALKKQVEILSNELHKCKKSQWKNIDLDICKNSNDSELSLEDCTELEYLRNILYEYMMGHQPLVLAKVLAAVVKFDNNQTQQVLQREEQKLSLLGHLGLT